MRIEQFEMLIKIAETNSMQTASDLLCTTIQNVSKSIKQLENELGVVIFHRTHHGVFLTTDGQFIYEQAKQIVNSVNILQNTYIHKTDMQRLRYSSDKLCILNANSTDGKITPIISKLLLEHPKLKISNTVTDPCNINTILAKNPHSLDRYDIITTMYSEKYLEQLSDNSEKYEIYMLQKTDLAIECGKTSPFCNMKSVNYKMIRNEPFISFSPNFNMPSQLFISMSDYGFPLNIAFYSNPQSNHNMSLIEEGRFLTLCTSDMPPSPNTVVIPIRENVQVARIMLSKKDDYPDSLINYVKESILKQFSTLFYRLY